MTKTPKKYLEKHKEYYAAHLKEIKEWQKQYYEKNKEKIQKNHREYEIKNREKCKIYRKNYRKRIRLECLIHYGGSPPKCACCGETQYEFLTIDHINGGGNQHARLRKRNSLYQWLSINNFPEGYRVLCYNCNCSLGHNGYCPHQTKREVFA